MAQVKNTISGLTAEIARVRGIAAGLSASGSHLAAYMMNEDADEAEKAIALNDFPYMLACQSSLEAWPTV